MLSMPSEPKPSLNIIQHIQPLLSHQLANFRIQFRTNLIETMQTFSKRYCIRIYLLYFFPSIRQTITQLNSLSFQKPEMPHFFEQTSDPVFKVYPYLQLSPLYDLEQFLLQVHFPNLLSHISSPLVTNRSRIQMIIEFLDHII